ncbi:MAG: YhdH/YhfP family quinone oxidoreductase [Planctomycetota bacterium]|nr:YhdH/YhfP family quinone oxidoreductase [Planctomycetota bacterium]
MPAMMASQQADGSVDCQLTEIATDRLPPGDVTIRVRYSSLNYKDALASQGHAGVVRKLPHIPGIDAAGEVVASGSPQFSPGQSVVITGFGLGSDQWGAHAQFIRVPAEWLVPLPEGLSLRQAMIYGTAGMTAAMCVEQLLANDISPSSGPVVVTGASGGVGSIAVGILGRLGFEVAAVSGKPAAAELLTGLGASRILSREEATDRSNRPMLKATWAGAVDTVGGSILATIVRQMRYKGTVTACGLVAGAELPLTVYPFILRGVRLIGIDSGFYPIERRAALWSKLATEWRPAMLEELAEEVSLQDLPAKIEEILQGKIIGRTIVRVD